jgi:hypothetical protein
MKDYTVVINSKVIIYSREQNVSIINYIIHTKKQNFEDSATVHLPYPVAQALNNEDNQQCLTVESSSGDRNMLTEGRESAHEQSEFASRYPRFARIFGVSELYTMYCSRWTWRGVEVEVY